MGPRRLGSVVLFGGVAFVAWLLCSQSGLAQVVPHAQRPALLPQRPLKDAVSVEAGASCLQQARLVDHVATWLGRSQVNADVRVVVRGDADDPRRISFDLIEAQRSRSRVFESGPEICGDLHAVVGLAIALAIDAEAMDHVALGGESTDQAPPTKLTLQGSVAYEQLPGVSAGGQVGAEFALWSWLSLRVDGLAQHSRADTIVGSRGTFDATLVAGAAGICTGGTVEEGVRFSLCSGLALGGVYAVGRGFSPNRSDTGLWFSVRSGLRIEVALGVPWLLDLDVISPLISPRFETGPLDAAVSVRTPSSAALGVSLGPAIVF